MGGTSSHFPEEQLQEYVDCTFFEKNQINRIYERFLKHSKAKPQYLTREEFLALPEVCENPLRERIHAVFALTEEGDLSFEDYLDFLSVFSERATMDIKASYAFRIYDVDNDGYLNDDDITKIAGLMFGENATPEQLKRITDKVFSESDLDGDRQISYVEFESIIKKSPDFVHTFRLSVV